MKKYGFLFFAVVILFLSSFSQSLHYKDSIFLISLNQQIDNEVVAKNITLLNKLYADDFVFSHGSGNIEGKKGWFVSVGKRNFISRQHDSVTVELHPQLAIVKGKLAVQKKGKEKMERYHLKYIRVYALRNKEWQMISHSTTAEFHEPDEED